MKLVLDSNILFTYFWGKSVLADLLNYKKLDVLSPEFALSEINKHEDEIIKKTGLTKKEFKDRYQELVSKITLVQLKDYEDYIKELARIFSHLNEKDKEELFLDIDFIALALKENCALWSNDLLLKKQNKVIVLSTKEVL
ncbi:MAG: PIN domain-containing protein [Nanoarchaeota archaeon]